MGDALDTTTPENTASTATTTALIITNPSLPHWIELTESKQFSRLLYTNPVCFLCCNSSSNDTGIGSSSRGENTAVLSGTEAFNSDAVIESPAPPKEQDQVKVINNYNINSHNNVMVLSWLTATNNTGQFMFSIHRRRHTASLLQLNISHEAEILIDNDKEEPPLQQKPSPGTYFTLSVPIQGMEEMVRAVGRVSGRYVNKFTSIPKDARTMQNNNEPEQISSVPSKTKNKKSRRSETNTGDVLIPGLKAIPIPASSKFTSPLFYIDGTVAYMTCQVVHIFDEHHNPDHYMVLGQIHSAQVLSTYWDVQKNIFRPMNTIIHNNKTNPNETTATTANHNNATTTATTATSTSQNRDSHRPVPPYLTFFGAQTFGYVVTTSTTTSDD